MELKIKMIRSRRRTVGLEITPEGELVVRAPEKLTKRELGLILNKHRRWINRKLALVNERKQLISRLYRPGEKFLYLGQEYPLKLMPGIQNGLSFDGRCFWITKNGLGQARDLFEKIYRKMARVYLSRRLELLSSRSGFEYKKFRLSSARRRWGSCSTKGTISLNWRLLMAPPEIIDYVIYHELIHLRERNHSQAFWNLLSKYVPDYRVKKKWLKENGFRLWII